MDEDVRRAERAVRADPSAENLRRLRIAVARATGTPPRPGLLSQPNDDWLCDEAEAVGSLGRILGDCREESFALWCLSYDTGDGRAFALLISRQPWPASGDDELTEQDYDPWGGNPDAVPVARMNVLDKMVSQGAYAWTIEGLRVASIGKAAFDGIGPAITKLLEEVQAEHEEDG